MAVAFFSFIKTIPKEMFMNLNGVEIRISVLTPKFLHPAREVLLFALNVFEMEDLIGNIFFRSNKSRIEETLS